MMTAVDAITIQLEAAFANLQRVLGLLEPDEIEQGRLASGWTPKALLAHIAFWDDFQTRRMQAAVNGESAATGFVRPLEDNDARAAADAHRPVIEIMAAAEAAHGRMMDFAASLQEQMLAAEYPEGARTLSLDKLLTHMANHTRSHTQELFQFCGSMRRWTRPDLRAFLVRQHLNLMDCIGGMTEASILASMVTDDWCVRDVLVHVLAWNEFGYRVVKGWPAVSPSTIQEWLAATGETGDHVNARLRANRSQLDMVAVVDGLTTVHRRMLRLFDKMSDDQLASIGDYGWGERGELSGFYYELALHDIEHAEEVWRCRQRRSGG